MLRIHALYGLEPVYSILGDLNWLQVENITKRWIFHNKPL